MNTERFIASRLVKGEASSFTRPVIRIGILSMALGMALMILSVSIVTGFQTAIRDKIIGINGHIQISRFSTNTLLYKEPVNTDRDFIPLLRESPGIRHVQAFASKAGILSHGEETEGMILRGAGDDFDWSYLEGSLKEGQIPVFPDSLPGNEVLVPQWLSARLHLDVGDKFFMFFVDKPTRPRAFTVSGIFFTGMEEEVDKQFIFGDIRHIQRLNDWQENQVEGFEVYLDDFSQLHEMQDMVFRLSDIDLNVTAIDELYPQVFDWLELLDMNVFIILALMILVAGVNMISTLLILILEKTRMIGILKSIGARNMSIRRVFIYISARLVFTGLVLGNLIGLGLGQLQRSFDLIPLDPSSYYMTSVPVRFNIFDLLALNLGSFLLILLMLLLPLWYISRISPSETMKYE